MSRLVIRDIVIPIVEAVMQRSGAFYTRGLAVQDPNLDEFLEEEMRRHFGVVGANDCQHLREQLEEARKNDPYAFEELVKRLLAQYVKLAANLRTAKRLKAYGQILARHAAKKKNVFAQ